ncbi:hypothetical protein M378DRAFT_179966 [Amanita muscaria Koide BX008]|uniref:Uncharacterized protein n=1 Tax=Amanita muscaria (strain Koide BX008) TaxID=946122 RepID=A0A0C2T581_AMAMK|nr:hypothetical protein M378DRAFT_179966 [Amanita muscaria Koide BX008]
MSRPHPAYIFPPELSGTSIHSEHLFDDERRLPMSSRFPNAQPNTLQTRDINAIIGAASGEQLIQSGNQAYIKLLLEKSNIEKEMLIAQKVQSDAFSIIDRNAYNEIHGNLQGLPSSTSTTMHQIHGPVSTTIPNILNNPFLHELSDSAKGLFKRETVLPTIFKRAYIQPDVVRTSEDYSSVRFWTLEDFKAKQATLICESDGKKNTLPKKLLFLEDEYGVMIPLSRLSSMRGILKGLFDLLKASLPEILKETWCQYDTEFQDIVYRELRAHFPELAMCNDNWKARSLLIEWYCNWYSHPSHSIKAEHIDHTLSHSTTMSEVVSDTVNRSPPSTSRKRLKTARTSGKLKQVMLPPIQNPLLWASTSAHNNNTNTLMPTTGMTNTPSLTLIESAASATTTTIVMTTPAINAASSQAEATTNVERSMQEEIMDVDHREEQESSTQTHATDVQMRIDFDNERHQNIIHQPKLNPTLPLSLGQTCPPAMTDPNAEVPRIPLAASEDQIVNSTPSGYLPTNQSITRMSDAPSPPKIVLKLPLPRQKKAPQKKKSLAQTAKALCGNDWIERIGGTEKEFSDYWQSLGEDGQLMWIAKSLQLKNQKQKEKNENAKAGGSGRGGEEQGNKENRDGPGMAGNDGLEQEEAVGAGGKKKVKRAGKRGTKGTT